MGVGTGSANHCALAQKCCHNLDTGIRSCASSCSSSGASTACYNSTECGPAGMVCCGTATVDTAACSYPTLRSFSQSICASSCRAGELVLCGSNADCTGGTTCTPVYVLNTAGTATTDMQPSVCR
jgi:hypothetical protein